MAHPDDPELACGGTIALWTKTDHVYYTIVTNGDKGTWRRSDSPYAIARTREQEARKAARYLRVKRVIFLRHPDGNVGEITQLAFELAALIRHIKPYTIVTHDPWRRQFHPDHRATGSAVIDAVMIARDWHFSSALDEIGLEPHRARELLMIPSDTPTFHSDITRTIERKIAAIKLHKSQLSHLYRWEPRVRLRAASEGRIAGCAFAEGFYKMRI